MIETAERIRGPLSTPASWNETTPLAWLRPFFNTHELDPNFLNVEFNKHRSMREIVAMPPGITYTYVKNELL